MYNQNMIIINVININKYYGLHLFLVFSSTFEIIVFFEEYNLVG